MSLPGGPVELSIAPSSVREDVLVVYESEFKLNPIVGRRNFNAKHVNDSLPVNQGRGQNLEEKLRQSCGRRSFYTPAYIEGSFLSILYPCARSCTQLLRHPKVRSLRQAARIQTHPHARIPRCQMETRGAAIRRWYEACCMPRAITQIRVEW